MQREREGGQWAVYYTSPQSILTTFSYSLAKNFGYLYWILIGWIIKMSVPTFQPHMECTCIYCILSHTFRTLHLSLFLLQKKQLKFQWQPWLYYWSDNYCKHMTSRHGGGKGTHCRDKTMNQKIYVNPQL